MAVLVANNVPDVPDMFRTNGCSGQFVPDNCSGQFVPDNSFRTSVGIAVLGAARATSAWSPHGGPQRPRNVRFGARRLRIDRNLRPWAEVEAEEEQVEEEEEGG